MSKQTKNNKYNRMNPGANQAVFNTFADHTDAQETVNTGKKRKPRLKWIPTFIAN